MPLMIKARNMETNKSELDELSDKILLKYLYRRNSCQFPRCYRVQRTVSRLGEEIE